MKLPQYETICKITTAVLIITIVAAITQNAFFPRSGGEAKVNHAMLLFIFTVTASTYWKSLNRK